MYDELIKMLRTCSERDSCIGWEKACPYLRTGACNNKAEKAADAIEELQGKGRGGRVMGDWRNDKPTKRQIECIEAMMEFSCYSIPRFTGATKGEACDYISRYGEIAHENVNSQKFGYE